MLLRCRLDEKEQMVEAYSIFFLTITWHQIVTSQPMGIQHTDHREGLNRKLLLIELSGLVCKKITVLKSIL